MLNCQWIGHNKLTHGHFMSRKQPPTYEDCRRYPTNNKTYLNRCPSQLFGSINKTMKQLLNNGDSLYGGTLYKFVISVDLPTKL